MNTINTKRRSLLKSFCTLCGAGVAASMGLMSRAVNAAWPEQAFDAESVDTAVNSLYGTSELQAGDQITLKAPDIAENGAVVPVSVSTDMPNVESISIYVKENPSPLAATFEMTENSVADVSTRIKMSKTSDVIAIVKADGKVYQTAREVKVTIGGCGG